MKFGEKKPKGMCVIAPEKRGRSAMYLMYVGRVHIFMLTRQFGMLNHLLRKLGGRIPILYMCVIALEKGINVGAK